MSTQVISPKEVGFVINARNYLITLDGLPSVRVNDVLIDDNRNRALVVHLEKEHVSAVLLDTILATVGDRYFKCEEGLTYSIGDHLFGRTIDALGISIDGKESLPQSNTRLEFDVIATGIDTRKEITEQFETGMALVDTLLPIGKGFLRK